MLKAARRASRKSGNMNMTKVVKESRCNDGINCGLKGLRKDRVEQEYCSHSGPKMELDDDVFYVHTL